jgi:hypothetical protein
MTVTAVLRTCVSSPTRGTCSTRSPGMIPMGEARRQIGSDHPRTDADPRANALLTDRDKRGRCEPPRGQRPREGPDQSTWHRLSCARWTPRPRLQPAGPLGGVEVRLLFRARTLTSWHFVLVALGSLGPGPTGTVMYSMWLASVQRPTRHDHRVTALGAKPRQLLERSSQYGCRLRARVQC